MLGPPHAQKRKSNLGREISANAIEVLAARRPVEGPVEGVWRYFTRPN